MKFLEGAPAFAAEVRSENDYGPKAEQEMADKRRDYFAAGALVVGDVGLLSDEVVSMCLASKTRRAIAARVSASMASRKTRQRRRRGTLACRLCEPHRLIERPTTG
jgi:hypothetical protein